MSITPLDEAGLIQVRDRIVPPALLRDVVETVEGFNYTFGWKSNRKTDPHGHWNFNILNSPKRSIRDHSENLDKRRNFEPIKRWWNWMQDKVLGPRALLRCYVNAHTYGVDGYPHTDSRRPRGEQTIVMYLNRHWDFDYAGETVIYNRAFTDIELAVAPKFGRLLIFPSDRNHCARAPSRKCELARITLIAKCGPYSGVPTADRCEDGRNTA